MQEISAYSDLALMLAGLFGSIGIVHLIGPRSLCEAYDRWNYPQRFRLVVGIVEIAAAGCLADPAWREWGIGLAVVINFGAVVTLFSHSQYLHAVPAIVMMVALVPATLAVPRQPGNIHFIAPSVQTAARELPSGRYVAQDGSTLLC